MNYNHQERFSTSEEERISKIISIIPKDVKTILDIGCGEGRITNSILDSFWVCATDMSQQCLTKIKTTNKLCCYANQMPFDDTSFDLVICCEVLEHISDQIYTQVLQEIYRISKKYILVSVPNEEDLHKGETKCQRCGERYHISGHLRRYDSSAKKLFSQCKVETIYGVSLRTERSLKFLYYILHNFGKKWAHSRYNVCPACGTHNVKLWKGNLIGYITERIIWNINRYFPLNRNNVYSWLVILFRKSVRKP